MKRPAIALLLATLACTAHATPPGELAAEIVRANPIKGAESVSVTTATERQIVYRIWYSTGQGNTRQARADTQKLIRATLAKFVEQGVKPTEDWKFISAHAAVRVPGETTTLAAPLITARYDPTKDQIEIIDRQR